MFKFFKSRLLLGIILYILCLQMPANSAFGVKDAAKILVDGLVVLADTLACQVGESEEMIKKTVEIALEDKPEIVEYLRKGNKPNHDHQVEILETIDIFDEKYQKLLNF